LPNIPPIASHSSSSIIPGWYNRPVVASVIVDSVPLHPPKKMGASDESVGYDECSEMQGNINNRL
jgi:hypothetical protein